MIYHYAVFILIGLTLFISVIGFWEFLELFVDNRLYFLFITTFLFYNYYKSVREKEIGRGETQQFVHHYKASTLLTDLGKPKLLRPFLMIPLLLASYCRQWLAPKETETTKKTQV